MGRNGNRCKLYLITTRREASIGTGKKNDISEQSKDVVSQVMAGRSDEKQMENVEGMVS